MKTRDVNAEDLRSGMMLWSWTRAARRGDQRFPTLQDGPEGCWQGMVLANEVQDPRQIDGFGYPLVHRVDVFFWNEEEHVRFRSFYWTAGTNVTIIEVDR